jgi:hypothetical protein
VHGTETSACGVHGVCRPSLMSIAQHELKDVLVQVPVHIHVHVHTYPGPGPDQRS